MLDSNSPLRRLPGNLDDRQALSLRGISFTIDMIETAYERLLITLAEINKDAVSNNNLYSLGVEALLDAWSLIDHVHRLRGLVQQMPRMRRSPALRLFLDHTAQSESFRNVIQHLREEVASIAKRKQAIWGALSWLAMLDPEGRLLRSSSIMYGALLNSGEVYPFPVSGVMQHPIDRIELTHGGQIICLSDIVNEVRTLTLGLEKALEKALDAIPEKGPLLGPIQLIALDIEPDWSDEEYQPENTARTAGDIE